MRRYSVKKRQNSDRAINAVFAHLAAITGQMRGKRNTNNNLPFNIIYRLSAGTKKNTNNTIR
jgi:hypothetical protein